MFQAKPVCKGPCQLASVDPEKACLPHHGGAFNWTVRVRASKRGEATERSRSESRESAKRFQRAAESSKLNCQPQRARL